MKTSPDRLRRRVMAQLMNSGTPVTLSWVTFTGGTVDPVTGARLDATRSVHTETVYALHHQVSATTGVRQHAEIEAGDLILDFAHDVELDGKEGLLFNVNGKVYRQKAVNSKLTQLWDVTVRGERITRTVVLELSV